MPGKELERGQTLVDGSLCGRGKLLLQARAELAEVVGVEREHLAREQREEPGLCVGGVGERVQQRAHDLDLGGLREGRAARDHALEAAARRASM